MDENIPLPPALPPVRRRRPAWGPVIALLGVALALFVIGAVELLQPVIRPILLDFRAANGLALVKEWNPIPGTALQGEPQAVELEDGTIQVRATFAGTQRLSRQDISLFCTTLRPPPGWTLASCDLVPGRPQAYQVIIQLSR